MLFFRDEPSNLNFKDVYKEKGVLVLPFSLNPYFCEQIVNDGINSTLNGKSFQRTGKFAIQTDYNVIHLELDQTIYVTRLIVSNSKMKNFISNLLSTNKEIFGMYNIIQFSKSENELSWHQDPDTSSEIKRLIGFSILLSCPKEGGEFEIKNIKNNKVSTVLPTKVGQIHVFNVNHQDYFHRVKSCTGNPGRISISGWYVTRDLLTQME